MARLRVRRPPGVHRDDERGAVAVTMAAVVTVLVLIAAFAVDLGMQRVARADMQSLADVVALDLARDLTGEAADTYDMADLQERADASRDRNGSTVGETPAVVPELGVVDPVTGEFRAVSGNVVPTAVRVRADTTVGFAFVPGSGAASRPAVATRAQPTVCFSIGTRTLALSTDESALSPLLGQLLSVNLDAIGYEGLVDLKQASVPLADLLLELDVGSTEQLLGTNVTAIELIEAAATVAQANGDTASAQILRAIDLGVAPVDFALSRILALQTGTPVEGLTAGVNVLELVTAGLIAANGSNGIDLDVGGVARVQITEPPQIACGRKDTVARSAQIRLRMRPAILGNATLGLVGGSSDLIVRIGSGEAKVEADPVCSADGTDSVAMRVTTGAVSILPPSDPAYEHTAPVPYGQLNLTVGSTTFLGALGPLFDGIVGGLLRALLRPLVGDGVRLEALISAQVAASQETRTITFPAGEGLPDIAPFPTNGPGQVLDLQAAGVRLAPNQGGLVSALGGVLNPALDLLLGGVVVPVVDQVLSPALDAVLVPLLDTLGIGLGEADLRMLGRPVCNNVRLVG